MRRLLALLGRRRRPQAPAAVEISWQCLPGSEAGEQFIKWMRKHIRPRGDGSGEVRLL